MSIRIFIFSILLSTAIFNSGLIAQNNNEAQSFPDSLEIAAKKLQFKLLLSEDQFKKVQTIIKEFDFRTISEMNKEIELKTINDRIDQILTRKQKVKFEILKNNWLKEIYEQEEKIQKTD